MQKVSLMAGKTYWETNARDWKQKPWLPASGDVPAETNDF